MHKTHYHLRALLLIDLLLLFCISKSLMQHNIIAFSKHFWKLWKQCKQQKIVLHFNTLEDGRD
jgi:hypothetical protein